MSYRFQLRRGTTAEWDAANPVLLEGEPGWDRDLNLYKLGDGATTWDALPAITGDGGGTGADGASAYEIAVDNGFVGTETQWLASLVGPQGETGPQGPQGIQGETGPAGADGEDGADLTHSTPQTINAQTGAYTLVAADAGKIVKMTLAAAADLTVPANVFTAGQRVDIADRGTARVTVLAGSGMTVNPPAGGSLVMEGRYAYASLVFISATEADLVGLVAAS